MGDWDFDVHLRLDNVMNISNLLLYLYLLHQLLDWWSESGLESLQQHSLPDVQQLDWESLPKSVHPQSGKKHYRVPKKFQSHFLWTTCIWITGIKDKAGLSFKFSSICAS